MNIVICTVFEIPHVGGASTHIELLRDSLEKSGIKVSLVSGRDAKLNWIQKANYFVNRVVRKNAARAHLLKFTTKLLSERIAEVIDRLGPNVLIHSHDPLATCAAAQATKGRHPIVQTVHGPWANESGIDSSASQTAYSKEIRRLEREAFGLAKRLIPVDTGQANILRESFGVSSGKINIIENAVDVAALQDIPPMSRWSDRKFFLVPRRLVPKNGVEYAIRAYARLKNRDVHLVIAGGGPLYEPLARLAGSLGVSEHVHFLGDVARAELLQVMRSSLAVVVPSVPFNGVVEATSLAVLEGMACGIPVIGSSIGGIQEIITDRRFGFLVEPADAFSLERAYTAVIELSPDQRKVLIRDAQQRILDKFGSDTWVRKIISVYDLALTSAIS
jgi:glycosyltransferase involved in cell wall biosynthesis